MAHRYSAHSDRDQRHRVVGGGGLERMASMAPLDANRNIGDFRAWKDYDAYQRTLERLLRDLRVEADCHHDGVRRPRSPQLIDSDSPSRR